MEIEYREETLDTRLFIFDFYLNEVKSVNKRLASAICIFAYHSNALIIH